MGEKPKESDESQLAIDRLVATARSDQSPREQDVKALIDLWGDDLPNNMEDINFGVQVTSIEHWCNDLELAYDEGIDQKDITDALRIKFAREKLARECADTDAGVVFDSVKITSSIGKSAWAVFAFTGYLRSDIEFFGIFADLEALTERLMKDGYVSAENADDTLAWITDEQILKLWSR